LQTSALPLGYVAALTTTYIITFIPKLHPLGKKFFGDW
jgi:hypothetical protein